MRTNTQIAFDDVGDREPAFLFLSGWCAPREAARPLYRHLERRGVALDWRGHGGSAAAPSDFGTEQLVEDALAVVEAARMDRFIPVGMAHAGFVAIELRKRLGPARVPGVALIDWMVLGGPPPFFAALAGLQQEPSWQAVRAKLFELWTEGVADRAVHDFVAKMARFGFDMWARGGREISAGFAKTPVPLTALEGVPTLHIYAQPADPAFLAAQQDFRAAHPWFEVTKVRASSHFPTIEAPAEVAAALESFARSCAG